MIPFTNYRYRRQVCYLTILLSSIIFITTNIRMQNCSSHISLNKKTVFSEIIPVSLLAFLAETEYSDRASSRPVNANIQEVSPPGNTRLVFLQQDRPGSANSYNLLMDTDRFHKSRQSRLNFVSFFCIISFEFLG